MSDTRTPSTGPPGNGEHEWFVRRLAPYWAGLLDDHESERLETHISTCNPCRRAWEAQAAHPSLAAGAEAHVPAALFADWERQQRLLRGLERAAIRHHLERCDDCRRDLRALGHEPVLEFVAALEPTGLMPSASPSPARPPRANEIAPFAASLGRLRRLTWAIGGWAATATATAGVLLVLLLRSSALGPDVELPVPGTGGPTLSSPGTTLAPALERAVAIELDPAAEPGPTAILPAGAARAVLALQLRGLEGASGDSATLVFRRAARVVVQDRIRIEATRARAFVVVVRGPVAMFGAGDYALDVSWAGERRRYAFRLATR